MWICQLWYLKTQYAPQEPSFGSSQRLRAGFGGRNMLHINHERGTLLINLQPPCCKQEQTFLRLGEEEIPNRFGSAPEGNSTSKKPNALDPKPRSARHGPDTVANIRTLRYHLRQIKAGSKPWTTHSQSHATHTEHEIRSS